MRSLIGWLAACLFSGVGWWLGRHVGLMTAVIVSSVAGSIGLYAGFRWFDQNLR
jgi:hypothetical protein